MGVVEHRPKGMRQGVAQFTALVDRARSVLRGMAGDTAGKRKLAEQMVHALGIAGNVRVSLAVGALQPGTGDHTRRAVTGAGNENQVKIALDDDSVEMEVEKVQPRRGAPVPEQPGFDVFDAQGLAEQR